MLILKCHLKNKRIKKYILKLSIAAIIFFFTSLIFNLLNSLFFKDSSITNILTSSNLNNQICILVYYLLFLFIYIALIIYTIYSFINLYSYVNNSNYLYFHLGFSNIQIYFIMFIKLFITILIPLLIYLISIIIFN